MEAALLEAPAIQHRQDFASQADRARLSAVALKAYLRLGGFVGEGAFIDRDFNTTDVCLILDTARMNDRQRRIYTGGRG